MSSCEICKNFWKIFTEPLQLLHLFVLEPLLLIVLAFDEIFRSSRPEVFCKKGVLRNFVKFTGKDLCQSLFFNKVAGLRPATLLKERLWQRCFPVNFTKLLGTLFLYTLVRSAFRTQSNI